MEEVKPLLTAILLLSRCGTVAATTQCTTKCGMTVTVMPSNWSCEGVQQAETAAIAAFRKYSADGRLYRCERLQGYTITVHPVESWYDSYNGFEVTGITQCSSKTIEVANEQPRSGSLTHEMAHAMQNCIPQGPFDYSNYNHSNWSRDGIYNAINEARYIK